MIAFTTTHHKLLQIKARIKLIQGGQGAGKNYAIAIHLLSRQNCPVITVMTDTYGNLKDGILTDYEHIFKENGLNFYNFYNQQDKILFWGDSKIQFRYLADHKRQAGKSKRRALLYINEGNKIGWGAVEPYVARSKEVIVDFNPDFEFWAHTELEPREDAELIIVTYKDNEMCPLTEVDYIESRKDKKEWFRVYGLGLVGTYSDLQIYSFKIIEEIPTGLKRLPNGMDFGQSPDPTCLIEMYVDGIEIYIDEIFSENNLLPEKIRGAERPSVVDRLNEIAIRTAREKIQKKKGLIDNENYLKNDEDYLKQNKQLTYSKEELRFITEIKKIKNWLIIGDSSGAVELRDMRKHGFSVRGVKKGKNSQYQGIKKLRAYNINVTKRSHTTIHGLQSWFWKTDHNDKIVPEPDGHEPDPLAAARYVVMAKAFW